MQLRGPGNIEGKEQSGVLDLKIADLAQDQHLLMEARNTVIALFEDDPDLLKPENSIIKNYFTQKKAGITLDKIS